MTRPLLVQVAFLAILVAACLPPDPFEFADTIDEPSSDVCGGDYAKVGSGRWQIERGIWGSSTTTLPGELAAAELAIELSDWTSEHLLDMHMELEVVAGQALPGQVLILRAGSEVLQEAKLAGPNGNQAHFDVELARDLCGTPCTLSLNLSGPLAATNVPVPLKMSGTLTASVDSSREKHPCYEHELTLVVTDAP